MTMTDNCLNKLKPIVSDEVHKQLTEAFEAGDQKAWDLTMQDSHTDLQYLRRSALIDANKRADIIEYITSQKDNGIKPQDALLDIISGSGVRQKSGVVSLDKYIEGVRGEYTAMNIDLIHATRTTMMGLSRASNDDFINNFVKAIFKDEGASVSKDVQVMVDAWHKTTKSLLDRFNKAGADVTELKDFNIPSNHYTPKMLKAGKDKWVADALGLFTIRRKPAKVRAEGKVPATDKEILERVFDNITQEGAEDFGAELGSRNRKLGNSHQLFRTLQPKSGADWLKYNSMYGRHNNPIDSMKEYIDSMATEIGIMEVLGTNPQKLIDDFAMEVKRTTGNRRAGDLAVSAYDHIRARKPRVEDGVTNVFRGLRSIQTITKLPLSGITALSDVSFSAVRSAYLGMNPVKVFTRQMKNLATTGDYQTAAKLGLLAEYANHMAVAASRYADSTGFSMLDRIADFAMRANGLNHWTNSARATFGLEFLSFMSEQSAKNYSDMPVGLARAFERYGISEADWNVIRKATTNIKGTDFLDPTSDLLDGGLKARVIGMIKEETNIAIPEPNAKIRAMASGTAANNSVLSEVVKTGMQFKTFGLSVFTSTLGVAMDNGIPNATKFKYLTGLALSTAVMGTVVVQLRDIAKGREPREFSMGLVKEGILQGGVLGVWGDMFFRDPNLFGGLPAQIAGPTVSDFNRIWKVMHATKDEVFKEGGDWAKELFPAIEQAAEEAAFPLRLWQTRVAAERLFLDDARRLTDPDYYSKIKRTKKWLRKERNQGFLSEPR